MSDSGQAPGHELLAELERRGHLVKLLTNRGAGVALQFDATVAVAPSAGAPPASRKIRVTVLHNSARRHWRNDSRWLPYRFIVHDEADRPIVESSRFYRDRTSCLADINLLFGDHTTVVLVEADEEWWTLRHAVVDG